jgi:hypothetical protein
MDGDSAPVNVDQSPARGRWDQHLREKEKLQTGKTQRYRSQGRGAWMRGVEVEGKKRGGSGQNEARDRRARDSAALDPHTSGGEEMEGEIKRPRDDTEPHGLDPDDVSQGRSLDLAIPVIKRTIPLLRRLRERADAARQPAVDDHAKDLPAVRCVGGCIQKGVLEISAKAAPDYTLGSVGAEPRESEASSGESGDPRKQTDRSRAGKTTTQRPDCSGPPAARRPSRPSGHPSETKPRSREDQDR